MQLHNNINNAYEALLHQLSQARVLLLHPRSKYRSILVAMLINDESIPSYYYALGPDDIDLRSFIEGFTHDMANQHVTFGRHLNLIPKSIYDNMEKPDNLTVVLDKFLKELNEMSKDDFLLILDEYDRSDTADDVHRFIEQLADRLPENCRLVLNSRSLPRLPWVSMVAKKQAALLLDQDLIEEDFYNNKSNGNFQLEVFALGPGNVIYNGTGIESWEGHLPRLLFFFALDKPVVTRSEICNAFWPDLPIDQAVNVFHVTKRRLHKALGIDVLVHEDSHYRVNPEFNVYFDVLDFVETLMRGRNKQNPRPHEAYQKAVELYKGPFLQGHSEDWILERRSAFRSGYLEAMMAMAQMWISKDRKELALKLYRQALDEDYYREDLHREIMKLYNELGRRSEAVAHFQNLEQVFQDESKKLNMETVSIYQSIKG